MSDARKIAAKLTKAQAQGLCFLSRVGSDRMPRAIETEEQLAAALVFGQLAELRLAMSAIDMDEAVTWWPTDTGLAVAAALRDAGSEPDA